MSYWEEVRFWGMIRHVFAEAFPPRTEKVRDPAPVPGDPAETHEAALRSADELAENAAGLRLRIEREPSKGWRVVVEDDGHEVFRHGRLGHCSAFIDRYNRGTSG